MTTSPLRRSSSEDTRLLERREPPAPRQNKSPGYGRPIAWGVGSFVTILGAGINGAESVERFIAGDKSTGGLFAAAALVCTGLGCLCLYRLAKSLTNRDVQPIASDHDVEAAKINLRALREINSRLMEMLPTNEEIDLEAGLDDSRLVNSINGRLLELEQILPEMRMQIDALRRDIQISLAGRSVNSPGVGALDSPIVAGDDSSFGQGLLGRLDALAKRVAKDQTSRNSSGFNSFTSSPSNLTGNASSFAGVSPAVKTTSPTARRIDFNAINNGDKSPQREEDK